MLRALMELGPAPLVPHPPLEVALLVAHYDTEEENRTIAKRSEKFCASIPNFLIILILSMEI